MNENKKINLLSQFILPRRFKLMKKVLDSRLAGPYILLEDIYQGHNASAVLRSADAFGFQNILAVEDKNKFKPNQGVSMGAQKWLSIKRFSSSQEALEWIKANNLKLVVTSTHCKNAIPLNEFVPEPDMVIAFGTELEGLSQHLLNSAELCVYISMYGFVESLNVSVSAAIFMKHIREQAEKNFDKFALSALQKQKILLTWLINEVKGSTSILKKLS